MLIKTRNLLCLIVTVVFAALAATMAIATAAYTFYATYQVITADSPVWSIVRAVGCLVLTLALLVLAQFNEFEYTSQPARRRHARKA
jgi:hypothetical protein